jgi:MOSC domain-containing protein YiiM
MATVFQINVSQGGVPKNGLHEASVGELGLAGDSHTSSTHGGPQRAVCLFSLERILALQAEGHPVFPGSTGENLTVAGLDWSAVTPGTRVRAGVEVELEVTQYTKPCPKIKGSFRDGTIERMEQDKNPGWSRVYARVVRGGRVRVGDAVTLARAPA